MRPLVIFGRVPFFFYLIHLYAIHSAALFVAVAAGWPTNYLFWSGPGPNLVPPEGYGLSVPGVYLMWALILLILYPLCSYFADIKARYRTWWLKYL